MKLSILLKILLNLLIYSGYLGPGGYNEYGNYYNCTGGATGYVDKIILGNHMYQNPTIRSIYKSNAFDPEGILGKFISFSLLLPNKTNPE